MVRDKSSRALPFLDSRSTLEPLLILDTLRLVFAARYEGNGLFPHFTDRSSTGTGVALASHRFFSPKATHVATLTQTRARLKRRSFGRRRNRSRGRTLTGGRARDAIVWSADMAAGLACPGAGPAGAVGLRQQ